MASRPITVRLHMIRVIAGTGHYRVMLDFIDNKGAVRSREYTAQAFVTALRCIGSPKPEVRLTGLSILGAGARPESPVRLVYDLLLDDGTTVNLGTADSPCIDGLFNLLRHQSRWPAQIRRALSQKHELTLVA